VIFKNN